METDSGGNIMAAYTHGNGLIAMNIDDANSYCLYDGLGSMRQLTDVDGDLTDSYTYDGFGNLIASTGSSDNPYGFTGEQQFSEADGLVFLRARYYDPKIGRFVSRDPIGYEDSMNLYLYCLNNPIKITDPSGEGIIVPDDGNDTRWECAKTDGFYRHCTSSCRLRSLTGSSLLTMLAALECGKDWPWQWGCPSTTSDILADLVGIALGSPSPLSYFYCKRVCKYVSKKVSKKVCKNWNYSE